jgi:glycosyltransferase 2 family protein
MRIAARAAVSVALVITAFYLLDWRGLQSVVRETSMLSFTAAIAAVLGSFVFLAFRWVRIVRAYVRITALEHWRVYFYASFLNSFTPANIGGDVYRAAALKRYATGFAALVVALLRERLFGLLSFLVGYVLCIAILRISDADAFSRLDPFYLLALLPIVIAIVGLAAGAPLVRFVQNMHWIKTRERLSALAADLADAMVLHSPVDFLVLLVLSLLALAAWIGAVAIVASDLGLSLSLPLLGAIAILTELVRMLPISLQGIGLREGSFSVLVGLAGGSVESGFILGAWSYLALSLALLACWPIASAIGLASRHRLPTP